MFLQWLKIMTSNLVHSLGLPRPIIKSQTEEKVDMVLYYRSSPKFWGSSLIYLQWPRCPLSVSGASCYYVLLLKCELMLSIRVHCFESVSRWCCQEARRAWEMADGIGWQRLILTICWYYRYCLWAGKCKAVISRQGASRLCRYWFSDCKRCWRWCHVTWSYW